MITYSKRRGRRSLAAILAAMLIASVLAVVAGTPAQAANTSSEVLIDTDGDLVPDGREFAGRDRYDTALKLAHNFAGRSQYSSVSTVFVASGESLVDSITVAGLAGDNNAPVLLTRSGSLHGGVADYIEDHGVANVFVLGGTAAISEAVETAIEGLDSKPSVTRIPGVDRYDTAARIAAMIGGGSGPASSWCRTPSGGTSAGTDAVLINGSTDALPFGVAVSTIANKLRMPVLMTAADELPSSTADFIRDYDVEHVQIIGGTDTVSAEVANSLSSLGVDSVARTAGATAAEVSVELAKIAAAGGSCNSFLTPVANDRVVLVRGNPDGIAAAPVLASGIAGDSSHGSMVTPLIVGDTLPASVRDYLAATPKTAGATKLDLGIIAIGGPAAVSAATMTAATTAAASTGALTVSIGAGDDPAIAGAREGDNNGDGTTNADDPVRPTAAGAAKHSIALYFSDDVTSGATGTPAAAALLEKLQDVIEVNGVPADVDAAVTGVSGGGCANNVVYVTLGQTLKDGDTISVTSSAHKFGTQDDGRTVATASTTVRAAAPDRVAPAATIIGIAEATPASAVFTVRFSDAGGFPQMAQDSALDVNGDDFTVTAATGKPAAAIASNGVAHPAVTAGDKEFTATVTINRNLEVGDRLTLKAGVISDRAKNSNRAVPGTAIKAQASPRVTSVLMSSLVHSAPNVWTLPATAADATTVTGGANAVTITAKSIGDAAGAAGNAWTILFDTASGHDAAKPLDIDVRVDTKRQRVTVRFVNGPATVHNLVAELKANSDFADRFNVTIPCTGTTMTPLAVDSANRNIAATATGAGRTQFAIEVNFGAYIASADDTALLTDVLDAALGRSGKANVADLRVADADVAGGGTGGGLDLRKRDRLRCPGEEGAIRGDHLLGRQPAAGPGLGRRRGRHRTGLSACATLSLPAISAVTAAANGYLADQPRTVGGVGDDAAGGACDRVNESMNGASQVRIAVSSSVKAR